MSPGNSHSQTVDAGATDMTADAALRRIGIDPATVETPDLATLQRIQRAHVTAVPFENLAIVGDPHGPQDGPGVSLSVPHLYEKVVREQRGGYCFELNGLANWLLAAVGYDIDRVAARITGDGGVTLPANHHSNIVHLDRRYVVDVGMGTPKLRCPVPVDGEQVTDDVGVTWRVAESDRPDAQYRVEFRGEDDQAWTRRYVFTAAPRDLSYFRATNDYLQSAPESTFTDGPSVSIGTADGTVTLDAETRTERRHGVEKTESVPADDWAAVLDEQFGVSYPFLG